MLSTLCDWSQKWPRTKWRGAAQGRDSQEVGTLGGHFAGCLPHPSKLLISILEVLMLADDLSRESIKVSRYHLGLQEFLHGLGTETSQGHSCAVLTAGKSPSLHMGGKGS